MNRGGGGGGIVSMIVPLLVIAIAFFFFNSKGDGDFSAGISKTLDEAMAKITDGTGFSASSSDPEERKQEQLDRKRQSGKPTGHFNAGTFYEVLGQAQVPTNSLKSGEIVYKKLDSRGRATGAYGLISSKGYEEARNRGRQTITVDPSGWGHNKQETITGVDEKGEERRYHGWFYNRSHLIADSLGGHPEADNLVTGTRMQNVGWNDGVGGMAYMEEKIRKFLRDNPGCDVFYSAIPNYYGQNDLLPKTVTVDARSCDNVINERVAVYNVAPGYEIDYTNGSYKKVSN